MWEAMTCVDPLYIYIIISLSVPWEMQSMIHISDFFTLTHFFISIKIYESILKFIEISSLYTNFQTLELISVYSNLKFRSVS